MLLAAIELLSINEILCEFCFPHPHMFRTSLEVSQG